MFACCMYGLFWIWLCVLLFLGTVFHKKGMIFSWVWCLLISIRYYLGVAPCFPFNEFGHSFYGQFNCIVSYNSHSVLQLEMSVAQSVPLLHLVLFIGLFEGTALGCLHLLFKLRYKVFLIVRHYLADNFVGIIFSYIMKTMN